MSNGIFFGTKSRVAILDMESINNEMPSRPMRDKPLTEDELKHWPWSPWGADNLKPQQMLDDIKKTASLTGIVSLKSRLANCEGLVPAIVKGSETGTRVIDRIVDDPEIQEFLDASNHFFQTAAWMEDVIGLGNGLCRWMCNKDGNKIVAFKRQDVSEMRYEKRDKNGVTNKIYLSGEWKNVHSPNDNRVFTLPLLRDWAPWIHAQELMAAGTKEFVSSFRYPGRDEAYYSSPRWYAAYKWVKYVQAVPEIKAATADNVMRPAWLVTIYDGFWKAQYEDWDTISDPAEKEKRKLDFFNVMDDKLNGKSNAGKNIYRAGTISMEFGKSQAYIDIEPMKGPDLDGQMLPDAAAGNSEIAFAEMMNLALIGGNQSAGPYTKNEGGSNIREASLFQIVITELERRYIKQLMNVPKYVNGWNLKYPGLEFIIPATALTTLDTGAGSKSVITGGVQPQQQNNGSNSNDNSGS